MARIMPGPNVVNLAMMMGARWFGLRGALAAMAGLLALPLVLVVWRTRLHPPWLLGAGALLDALGIV